MSKPTQPDIHCVVEDLTDPTVLPEGWCMIIRENPVKGDNDMSFVGLKYLSGTDPLAKLAAAEARLSEATHLLDSAGKIDGWNEMVDKWLANAQEEG